MKKVIKIFLIIMLTMLTLSIYAQDKATALINHVPNSNFVIVKIKNAKELKAGLENHPLKKLLYNDKTKELIDEILQSKKVETEDADTKEIKDLEKKSLEKLWESFIGEIILSISFEKLEDANIGRKVDILGALIATVNPELFQEFIKADIAFEEKSKSKKTITKKQHENIEYYSMVVEGASNNSFTALVKDKAILSTNEETLKKIITSILKNVPIENGLKNNEKFFNFLNANQNKDILFSADFAPIFKSNLSKEQEGPSKIALEALKLEKLFQIDMSFDIEEKVDNFEMILNCLDEGCLQFATFTNNEFVPAAYISSDVSAYSKIFFSLPELKKKIIEYAKKISPDFEQQYPGMVEMAKTNFQFDIEGFFDSIGEDIEFFSTFHKDDTEEALFTNKLKNQSVFITNLGSILNNPMAKQVFSNTFSVVENKEGGNQFWVFMPKTDDPKLKESSFALGSIESYAFLSKPGSMAQKHIALIKKGADTKLSSSAGYNSARALYPAKLSLFSYAITKDLILNMQVKLKGQEATLSMINPNFNKVLKILEEIKAEDFKGNISYGLWKDTNKLSFSAKLNNK